VHGNVHPYRSKVPQGLGQEYRLAAAHALTCYDAAYLAVALGSGARLATNDEQLRNVAEKLGVALYSHASGSAPPSGAT
jgi:predicted nucleic acid-binding protein